jgi:methionine aminotransferase
MKLFDGHFNSKLPGAKTSVFAVMTKLALDFNAVNLSQGFPDFPIDKGLIERVHYYMKKGFNQYAPMPGVPELRKAVSQMFKRNYDAVYDPEKEITITAGATQALYTAISAFIDEGDEAIIFEPAYDSYAPAVLANGGMVKFVSLKFPDFSINWDEVKRNVTSRTKLIILNTPHNPTGSVLKKQDFEILERFLRGRDIMLISDEVYEHLIFDDETHYSACLFPDLASRTMVIGSFGKTFHATGWKTGFVLAPENITAEFRKFHQFVVFASNTPIQHAIADFVKDPVNYESLGTFYQQKRDYFLKALEKSRFKAVPAKGTYFQLLDYSNISDEPEYDFAKRLVTEFGIAAIPLSPFYHDEKNQQVLRFCFAKQESTLDKAAEILCRI